MRSPLCLLPLPYDQRASGRGLDCGGESRGEGDKASGVAPSPEPSPPQDISLLIDIAHGGEGTRGVPPFKFPPERGLAVPACPVELAE